MMNLFEIFDPSTSLCLSLNWIILLIPLILNPMFYWIIPSRILMIWILFIKLILKEFKMITTNTYSSNIIMFLSMMIYFMLLNFLSLIPYISTATSQMSFNLTLALTLWTSFLIYMLYNTFMKFLIHLIPMNTPVFLMNFMVMIEMISNIIRPWTLTIRLTANLTAGHLLMTLLGMFISNIHISLIIPMILIQNIFFMLEISMALIQAYVYSILTILYFSESKK